MGVVGVGELTDTSQATLFRLGIAAPVNEQAPANQGPQPGGQAIKPWRASGPPWFIHQYTG